MRPSCAAGSGQRDEQRRRLRSGRSVVHRKFWPSIAHWPVPWLGSPLDQLEVREGMQEGVALGAASCTACGESSTAGRIGQEESRRNARGRLGASPSGSEAGVVERLKLDRTLQG